VRRERHSVHRRRASGSADGRDAAALRAAAVAVESPAVLDPGRGGRRLYTLDRTHRIAASPSEVFAFFSDPANLARLTPPDLRFRIHGEAPARLAERSRIEYRIRWTVLTLRWVTRITRWRPPAEFEDVQEAGPYAAWTHTHRFVESGGAVAMHDHVEYGLPFGILGRAVHRLLVRRQLEAIFDYREHAIDRIFPP
jgi:ligand-binding SRPBCC domain-containing protein